MKKQNPTSTVQLPSPSPQKNKKQISPSLELQKQVQLQSNDHTPNSSLPKINNKQSLQKHFKSIVLMESPSKMKSQGKIEVTYERKYEWVQKQIDYTLMRDQEIKEENLKLRAALKNIDLEVDEFVNSVESKIEKNVSKIKIINEKSRLKSDESAFTFFSNGIEHRKEIQNRESMNNQFQLKMCKKEYIRLKKREKFIVGEAEAQQVKSNTAVMIIAHSRCKERLQTSIEDTVNSIAKTKEQNKKIKYRNKTLGESIHGTDEFIENMKRLQFQVEFESKTKLKLEKKLQECENSVTEVCRKLFQMKSKFDTAEQYLEQSSKKEKDLEDQKSLQETLKKKEQLKQLADKKKEFELHNRQYNYHNLLKSLDDLNQSIKKIDSNIKTVESENFQLKGELKSLESKLEKLRMLKKSLVNETKIGLMLLSNQLQESQQEIKSQYSIPLKDSSLPQKQDKRPPNYLTGTIQKSKNQAVQSQTEPQFGQISSIKDQQTKNSPHKNKREPSRESEPLE